MHFIEEDLAEIDGRPGDAWFDDVFVAELYALEARLRAEAAMDDADRDAGPR